MVLSTVRVTLPTSINLIKKIPHGYAERLAKSR